ncbi:uncharacterized protein LOC113752716 [Coffea eugenioides]|uniref:uncharacterized protein LOC113752716 n=1 Tax=Coffea eugenioides TaxID=49369 RepID=UPI000F60C897|nr:uncharacterized protein LOC113752716 [Coffea eugenioides]
MAIKKEVDEIKARIWWSDEVALMKKDGKERLKVNEMLMALLFVLDSVLSVDSGVRNLRKAVIRKVIALQERVDAVAATAASADIDRIQPEPDTLAKEEKDHQARDQALVIQHVAAAGANSSNSEGRPPEIQDLADGAVGNSVQKVHFSVVQVPQSSDVVDFENNGSAQGVDRGDDVRADSEMKAKDCVEDAEEFGIDPKMKVDGEACLDEVTLLDIVENKGSSEARVVESLTEDKEAQVFDSVMENDGEVEDMREKTPAFSECVEKAWRRVKWRLALEEKRIMEEEIPE